MAYTSLYSDEVRIGENVYTKDYISKISDDVSKRIKEETTRIPKEYWDIFWEIDYLKDLKDELDECMYNEYEYDFIEEYLKEHKKPEG